MNGLFQDLRYALRTIAKSPGFTAVAALTLALGIGANTTMFSVVNAILLRPLPYPNARSLVGFTTNQSGPDLEDFSRLSRSFSQVAGAQNWPLDWSNGAEPERVQSAVVTGQTFAALGGRAELGRTITPADDRPGAEPVVVVGYGFWQSRLGGERSVLGRVLSLGGKPYTVIGVMPAAFEVPRAAADMWLPFRIVAAEAAPARGAHLLRAFGHLIPGVSLAAVQAELDAIAGELKRIHPEEDREQAFRLVPLQEQVVARSRPTLFLLFSAVFVVLLISCANFANLLLSRSARQSREIAIRSALGAGRSRLVRQLVTESVLISALGGAAGLLVAAWAQGLAAKLPPVSARLAAGVRLDVRVFLFALAVSTATGVLFGLLPALQLTRVGIGVENLAARVAGNSRESRVSRGLVVWEIAVALVLLNGAGLLFKGLSRLASTDPGFRTERLLTFRLDLPETRYAEIPPQTRFLRSLLERLSSLPGVTGAALISDLPVAGSPLDHNVVVEGGPVFSKGSEPSAYTRLTSPAYFRTMGIEITRGRALTEADREGAPLVGVVNETMVRDFFRGRDPIGARIRWARLPENLWMTVVGVARDVRHLGLAQPEGPAVYTPYSQKLQKWQRWTSVVVRAQGDPLRLTASIKAAVRAIDPDLPITEVATMQEVLASSMASPARRNLVISLFAALALGLAGIGVYGVISQTVSRRTREIGVRIALGASATDVIGLVLRQAIALGAIGVALGMAGGALLARAFLSKLLFGVSAIDPATYAAMAAALFLATLLASGLPARRALRVDPMVALRNE
jgi:putative ABC transport system permease protein